ncbi:hypothetical protein FB45DRAFT_888814 [Roridomyces roridus]|uniref:Uncharacterized protein n=1 Tax=Roridomyces roridus TaxID=1738132 RepID=A0AAD7CMK5_9AGAR|nr:hypothetical protein FB45DRAFT_888814 [Roridomyces roridus]
MTIENQLELLRESIAVQVPYTGGVHLVKEDDLAVYYDVQGEERPCRVDLGTATEIELAVLLTACQKATFGVAARIFSTRPTARPERWTSVTLQCASTSLAFFRSSAPKFCPGRIR